MLLSVESRDPQCQPRADQVVFPAAEKPPTLQKVKTQRDLGDDQDLTSYLTDVMNEAPRGGRSYLQTHG